MDYLCEHCKIDLHFNTFRSWASFSYGSFVVSFYTNFRQELHVISVFPNIKKKKKIKIVPHIVHLGHMTFKFRNSATKIYTILLQFSQDMFAVCLYRFDLKPQSYQNL